MTCTNCKKQRSKKGKLAKGANVSDYLDDLERYQEIGTVAEIEELIDAVAESMDPENTQVKIVDEKPVYPDTLSIMERVYLALIPFRGEYELVEQPDPVLVVPEEDPQ